MRDKVETTDVTKKSTDRTASKKTCFVVTPIGKPDSDIRRHIDGILEIAIRPVFEGDYTVEAAHTCFESTSITKQVYQKLYESDLVIVDLTGLNPNVMYELGIRFCFGKPVILIAEEGTRLPFDINERRTLFFKGDPLGFSELVKPLARIRDTVISNEINSPIHDALSERKLFREAIDNSENSQIIKMMAYMLNKIEGISDRIVEQSIYVLRKELNLLDRKELNFIDRQDFAKAYQELLDDFEEEYEYTHL